MRIATDIGHQDAAPLRFVKRTKTIVEARIPVEPVPGRHHLVRVLAFAQGFYLRNGMLPLSIAQQIECAVPHDGVDPAARGTMIVFVLMRMGPDPNKGILHNFLSKLATPDNTLGDRDQTPSLTIIDDAQGIAITLGAGGKYRFEIVRPRAHRHKHPLSVPTTHPAGVETYTRWMAEWMQAKSIFLRPASKRHGPRVFSSGSVERQVPGGFQTVQPRRQTMKTIRFALIASAASIAMASSTFAAPVLGLTGDKTLVMFDTAKPAVAKTMDVTGVDKLIGIDFRPGNKTVIGVTPDHRIVAIDLETGAATDVAKMDKMLTLSEAPVVVDFNPMADRLRFMTGTTNHRVHPDTGAVTVDGGLAFEDGDMHKGETPNIVAAAYTNSVGKPEKTAMYNIDATIDALIQQTKPNDGTLKAIGKLGLKDKPSAYAFDIQGMADGTNTAYLAASKTLYTVNLETGAATEVGPITGLDSDVRDIAILPAM